MRGSYAEGFKAPNLEQINARVVTRSNTRVDYVRCEAQLRTGAITSWPRATSAARTEEPMYPVAPVRTILIPPSYARPGWGRRGERVVRGGGCR